MNILSFPSSLGKPSHTGPNPSAPELEADVRTLFDRFFRMRCVARGLAATSIQGRRRIVERFLAYCQCPPWEVTAFHYDAWMGELVLKGKITVTTQRSYQSAIDNCFRYWTSDVALQNQLLDRYGSTIQCPINDDNRIVHKHPHQRIRRKTPPTREHLEALLGAMARLRDAYWQDPATEHRGWCVERDRVAFAIQYYLALRIGEIVSLNVESFHEASWAPPELGSFAVADVIGKGSACQGPKQRTVMVTNIQVRTMLEWYLEHVRPRFSPAAQEHALFLTRAGTRLGRSYYIHFFQRYLRIAGLHTYGYSTHALRRAGLTHTAQRTGIFFAQQQGGHVYLSTTQDYVEIADDEIRELHHQAASQTIARVASRITSMTPSSSDPIEA